MGLGAGSKLKLYNYKKQQILNTKKIVYKSGSILNMLIHSILRILSCVIGRRVKVVLNFKKSGKHLITPRVTAKTIVKGKIKPQVSVLPLSAALGFWLVISCSCSPFLCLLNDHISLVGFLPCDYEYV